MNPEAPRPVPWHRHIPVSQWSEVEFDSFAELRKTAKFPPTPRRERPRVPRWWPWVGAVALTGILAIGLTVWAVVSASL